MDLNDVALFARVVESGSFTAAAASLGLPKSSVSRGVARLEAALGVRLLHRTTRRLRLSDAGRVYLDRASVALSGLDEARALVTDLGTEVRGTVRVTAAVDVGVRLLPPIVARFVALHPRVRVELSLTGRVVDLVEEGFDLAIRAGKLADSSLVARKLGVSRLGLFASTAYLGRRGAPRAVADLAAHDCVLFRTKGGRATWRLEGPEGDRAVEVRGAITADEMSCVSEILHEGAGIGVLPPFLAKARPGLVRVLPRHAMAAATLAIVSPPVRYEPACVGLLREALVRELDFTPEGEARSARAKASRSGARKGRPATA